MSNPLRAEEIPVGTTIHLGEYFVSRSEIVTFAMQWDPQPFHVDEQFARKTVFGDLIGSGLHTMAIFQRLAVLGAYHHWAVVAGRAIRDVSLTHPLRPDSTVTATLRVDTVTPRSEKQALVTTTGRVFEGESLLLTLQVDAYVQRRDIFSGLN